MEASMNNQGSKGQDFADEIIDLEEYAKANKVPPLRCQGYRIRIDKQKYVVTQPAMTGRQLLELAEKTPPEQYRLDQKLSGGQTKKIGLDEKADFTTPGVERFMTLPLDQTEGYSNRRQFRLPSDDEEYLNARGFSWETLIEYQVQRTVVYGFPVPSGYNHTAVALSLRIEPGYPDVQIDMAYFYPPLARTDGRPINSAHITDHFEGKQWQGWSRHRTSANPWRPGIDNIGTHIAAVEHWLEKELTRG